LFFAIVGAVIAVQKYGGRPLAILSGMLIGAMIGFAPVQVLQLYVFGDPKAPSYFTRIQMYFEALREGDPFFWGCTVVFGLLAVIIVVAWIKTAREFKREDERKRRGRGH
jgi:hypothetical protein